MSRFLNVLRSWLVMTSVIAMGYSLQGFRDHTFLYEKLYTSKPDLVNGLQALTFGVWPLLSSVVRGLCAIDIHNKRRSRFLRKQDQTTWKTQLHEHEESLGPADKALEQTAAIQTQP